MTPVRREPPVRLWLPLGALTAAMLVLVGLLIVTEDDVAGGSSRRDADSQVTWSGHP